MISLAPHLAKLLARIYRTSAACGAGVYESLKLLAQESRENPREKACFSSGLFPSFPRMLCIRVGRQRRPGQKHKAIKFVISSK